MRTTGAPIRKSSRMSSLFSTVAQSGSLQPENRVPTRMDAESLVIRPSRDEDLSAITAIYGYHVLHGVASFEEIPPELAEMAQRRRQIAAQGLPYLVAERQGRVLGYCYASV